eukprot:TRINITY_DN650_c0_g2_i4.p1 TRINITY_DN650_c0_g2~~TRINITY_DN650_c0_g2_i4.p1  ORF type:complete len:1070 (+),score=290.46 TRINITY_DN650_c0_g2_i4:57-3266(+)
MAFLLLSAALLPLGISRIAANGDAMYVGDSEGLHVVDVRDPAAPSTRTLKDTQAYDVLVVGGHMYVCMGLYIDVYNVSNPLTPVLLTTFGKDQRCGMLKVDNGLLYTNRWEGLHIFDLRNPVAPEWVGEFAPLPDRSNQGYYNDFQLKSFHPQGDYVFTCYDARDASYLIIVDVRRPDIPTKVDLDSGAASNACASDDGVYSVDARTYYHFDRSDGRGTFTVEQVEFNVSNGTAADGEYYEYRNSAYGSSGEVVGKEMYSLTTARTVHRSQPLPSLHMPGLAGYQVIGTTIFIRGDTTLYILDTTTPTAPTVLGAHEQLEYLGLASYYHSIAISGSRAYFSAWLGLYIYDIITPSALVQLSHLLPKDNTHVVVNSDVVYMAGNYNGLFVVDVRDPAEPKNMGGYGTVRVYDLVVGGGYLYVCWGERYVEVYDVGTDALAPVLVTSFGQDQGCGKLELDNGRLYTNKGKFLHIFDVSNPASPRWVGEFAPALGSDELDFHAESFSPQGNYVYTCYLARIPQAGRAYPYTPYFIVVDVTHPEMPAVVDRQAGDLGPLAAACQHSRGMFSVDATTLYFFDKKDPKSSELQLTVDEFTFIRSGSAPVDGNATFTAVDPNGFCWGYDEKGDLRCYSRDVNVTLPERFSPTSFTVTASSPIPPVSSRAWWFQDYGFNFQIDGTTAYAHGTDYVYILDIADPKAPKLLSTYTDTKVYNTGPSSGLMGDIRSHTFAVSRGLAYFATATGLFIHDFGKLPPTPAPTPFPTSVPTPSPTAVPTPVPPTAKYFYGCFKTHTRFLSRRVYKGDANTPSSCAWLCKEAGYRYAGVEDGAECWCGDSVGSSVKTVRSECDKPCTGDGAEACGGVFRMGLYSLEAPLSQLPPSAVGCYAVDASNRALGTLAYVSNANSVGECASACAWNKHKYASLENGNECWCMDSVVAGDRLVTNKCGMACPGESSEKCGNTFRSSVYLVDGSVWSVPAHTYEGCYTDRGSERALPVLAFQDPGCTVEECVAVCAGKGFAIAGLRHRSQCWCGDSLAASSRKTAEYQCRMSCRGNPSQICGYAYRHSVYSIQ